MSDHHRSHNASTGAGHRPAGNGAAHSPPLHGMHHFLERFSGQATAWAGSSWSFATAVALLMLWAMSGPFFRFSENWQLIVNTSTTIVTFLMVFLIQRAQNKEALAVQIKLNELLASQRGASNRLINAEDLTEDEIRDLHCRFARLAAQLDQAADDGDAHSVNEADDAARAGEHEEGEEMGGTHSGRQREAKPSGTHQGLA
jgi:low affinity Fe/Cu permease